MAFFFPKRTAAPGGCWSDRAAAANGQMRSCDGWQSWVLRVHCRRVVQWRCCWICRQGYWTSSRSVTLILMVQGRVGKKKKKTKRKGAIRCQGRVSSRGGFFLWAPTANLPVLNGRLPEAKGKGRFASSICMSSVRLDMRWCDVVSRSCRSSWLTTLLMPSLVRAYVREGGEEKRKMNK